MSKNKDDLEAVRNVVTALEGFDHNDQERIIRWAKEKLGLASVSPDVASLQSLPPPPTQQQHHGVQPQGRPRTDIKTFFDSKDPKNDQHFAATIAYYYRFEAPESQRKEEISGKDLQEAARQVGRRRLRNPGQTLINAHFRGLLDKGSEPGTYTINAVGENLVAMTLPVGSGASAAARARSNKGGKKNQSSSSKASSKKKVAQARKQTKISKQST